MQYQYNAAAFCYPYRDAVICNLMNCAAILHTPLHAARLNTPMSEFILYEWPSFVNVCRERKRRPTAEVGAANEVNEGPKYLSSAFLTYIRQSKSTLLWTQIDPNVSSTSPTQHLRTHSHISQRLSVSDTFWFLHARIAGILRWSITGKQCREGYEQSRGKGHPSGRGR